MTRTIKTVLFSALVCLSGCAAAQPKPEVQPAPVPTPPAAPRLFIKMVNLSGWQQLPSDGGGFILENQALSAHVQILTFIKQDGEPRDMVGWFMVQLMSQGAAIGDLVGAPGDKTAWLDFRAKQGEVDISGVAAAKWSSVNDIGFLLIGVWPAVNEPAALAAFKMMFLTVDLSSE